MRSIDHKLLLVVFAVSILNGCAGTPSKLAVDLRFAVSENTERAYREFITKHPGTADAKEAQKRIDDPDWAFMRTCQVGTAQMFEGFLASHPASVWAPVSQQRIEFLKATESLDLESFRRFIDEHRDNPFVKQAIVAFPLLWLKKLEGKVGVAIVVSDLKFKGLLRENPSLEEKYREMNFPVLVDTSRR